MTDKETEAKCEKLGKTGNFCIIMCLSLAFMRDVSGLFLVLPRVRESKKVLDSGFHAMNSGFQVLDSGFQLLVGFRLP